MSASCWVAVRPSGVGSSIFAATWSFSAATRIWKNSSRLVVAIAQNFARSMSGMPASVARSSTRSSNAIQLSSRLMKRSSIVRNSSRLTGPVRGTPTACARSVHVWDAEIPLERDQLALCVADHALAIAAELGVVARQQHEASEHSGAELLEHGAIAPVAVHLPVG